MTRARGLGCIYLRGKTYWIDYSVRGKRHPESSGSSNRADAVRLLKQRIKEAGSGKPFGVSVEKTTLGDLIDMIQNDYKANGKQLRAIKAPTAHVLAYFGKDRLAIDVTTDAITKYITTRQESGAKNSTINRSLAALKHSFKLAEVAEKVAKRPHIKLLEEDNARQGFVCNAEFERLRDALPADLRDPVAFLYHSGWRVAEMKSLQWRDIKEGAIRLRRENSKNKKGRILPLRRELAAIIERAAERRLSESPFVFHRDGGQTVGAFRKSWATACRKAGLGAIIVHDLRRSAIKNMVDARVPETTAMMISGHRTRSTFTRYAITTEEGIARALEDVADHLAAQPQSTSNVVPLLKRTGE
jgi:integrase